MTVSESEVCASTPSVDLQPYASEYEGYMGNYGNTMDRWYRRAALVVWPRHLAFRNRAEGSPASALDELDARVRAKDLAGAQTAAATLAPLWEAAARRAEPQATLFGKALRVAPALDDAVLAEMLLRPFRIESLRRTDMASLARLAGHYGIPWVDGLLRTWFPRQEMHSAGQDRREWLASLPRLCEGLRAKGDTGTAIAHRLLELAWGWLREEIGQWVASPRPTYRDGALAELGPPLAAVLTAVAVTEATALRDEIVECFRQCFRQQEDPVTACLMPALRAVSKLPADTWTGSGCNELAAECAARLRERLADPLRPDGDWSIDPPNGCACELCGTLGTFLRDPGQRTFEWPLAKGAPAVRTRSDRPG